MNKEILVLLNKSFDMQLTEEEEKRLAEELDESEELRQEKSRIERIRTEITKTSATSFSPFFTEKVMREIDSIDESVLDFELISEWFTYLFRRIVFAGVAAAIILILFNFIIADQVSLAGAFGIPEITIEEVIEPVFAFNTGGL